jgi:3-oxoacyl-[acyl-carrier-protein] synthase-3
MRKVKFLNNKCTHSKALGYFVPSNVVTNDDLSKRQPMTSGFRKELASGKEALYREKIPLPQWGVKAAEICRSSVAKEDIDFVFLPH